MDVICIDSVVLGTQKHLVIKDQLFAWSSVVPAGCWHLNGSIKSDSDRCLDTAFRLGNVSPSLLPPEQFVRQMASLCTDPIPWHRVMPVWAHRAFMKRLVDDVVVAMAKAPLDYYKMVWVPGNRVYRSLHRASVDRDTWERIVAQGDGNVPAVASFEPDHAGLSRPIVYDRLRTVTGRPVVVSGPQILTLKKEHRKMLRSVYGDRGSIHMIDFAALEARVLLYEYGRRCDDVDLYGTMAKELGYKRDDVKAAVLTELYGGGEHSLGTRLGISGNELQDFIRKVQVFFNTDDLLARIKAQFIATGMIVNRYGRPIVVDEPLDHVFIAYYGQSTGVDVTVLGFDKVIQRLTVEAPRVRPVFVLFDALFIDVHEDDLPIVRSMTDVKVPGYVQRFHLRLEKISP